MAIEKIVEIKVDAKQATKSLQDLGGSFEDVYGEIQPLSGRIGELEDRLYEMAAAGESGTKEFKDLTREIGSMKKVIIDTDRTVDGMSQTMAQNLGGALGGVTAAFELGAGAMGAMGVESEKVQEALLKVQSAMAIAQGVQGIREAIPAFNGLKNSIVSAASGLSTFKKALIATGLGAIVALVGALAANWDKVTEFLGGATKAQKALKQSLQEVKGEISKVYEEVNQMTTTFKLAQEGVVSKEDALKEYNETIGKTLGQAESLEEAESKFSKGTDAYIKAATLRAQAQQLIKMAAEEQTDALLASEEDNRAWYTQVAGFVNDAQAAFIDYSTLGLTNVSEASDQINEYLKNQATEQLITEKNNNTKRYNELAASLQEELALLEKNNGFVVEADEQKEKDREAAAKEAFEKRKAQIIAEMDEEARLRRDADNFFKEYQESKKIEKELKDKELLEDIERERALTEQIQASLDAELAVEEAKVNAAIEADNKKKELAEAELQRERELQDAKLSLASESLGAISGLVTAFAGESEAAQKKAFEINKAISIGQAIISTAQGVIAQLAVPQDALTGANFIKAGIVAATGAAQIATIARTQYKGGGSTPPPPPNAPTTSQSQPANFNVVGNTGTNQLADTLGSSPMKAYVVAGDVTSAQSLERNKIQQSTI